MRNARKLSQQIVGHEIGITQQNFSRYENDINTIPVDMLIKLSKYFNVSTDYILGVSNTKRNLEGQLLVNKTIEENYEFCAVYVKLSKKAKKLIWDIVTNIYTWDNN